MVTVITATGNPLLIDLAHDTRVEGGRLVCLDVNGQRLISFDALDVKAFAVENNGQDPEWIMGGLPLLHAAAQTPPRPLWRLPSRLRLTYR